MPRLSQIVGKDQANDLKVQFGDPNNMNRTLFIHRLKLDTDKIIAAVDQELPDDVTATVREELIERVIDSTLRPRIREWKEAAALHNENQRAHEAHVAQLRNAEAAKQQEVDSWLAK